MKNRLAIIGAFLLSTSLAVSAVSCGQTIQTTTNIFDWDKIISSKNNTTKFFQELANSTESGIGQTLYKKIVDSISLSILKTSAAFADTYTYLKELIENEATNLVVSLKNRGGNWKKALNDFLKKEENGGNGITGSIELYKDSLLLIKAAPAILKYYASDNLHNLQFYTNTDIDIWWKDIYYKVKQSSMEEYQRSGIYQDKLWIVSESIFPEDTSEDFKELTKAIADAKNITDITLTAKVPKRVNDQRGGQYIKDQTIVTDGVLSDQQVKLGKVQVNKDGLLWVRQIFYPFSSKSTGLKEEVNTDSFSDNKQAIEETLETISKNGFEAALKAQTGDIKSIKEPNQSGDLGLIKMNEQKSDESLITTTIKYAASRFITSAQGVGKYVDTTTPFEIEEYKYSGASSLEELLKKVNHPQFTGNNENHTSKFNDITWITDNSKTKNYSGYKDDKVAIFTSDAGLHIIQTPGITYKATQSSDSKEEMLVKFNQLTSNPTREITMEDTEDLINRPAGGSSDHSYFSFLQQKFLTWVANKSERFFDLNALLNEFTTGAIDINSNSLPDFVLFMDNNFKKIHWNKKSVEGLTKTELNASEENIDFFIKTLEDWISKTIKRRWNSLQGALNIDTLMKNIDKVNESWDNYGKYAPVARLNPQSLKVYLINVAFQVLWFYDANTIRN